MGKREKKEIVIPDGRDFKGVWIPERLYLTREFAPNEKFLLIEIWSLTKSKNKQCYASNKHFADFIGLKENTIQKMILKFENAGYLKRSFEYKEGSKEISKRIITLTNKFYDDFVNEHENENEQKSGMENNQYGYGKKSMRGDGLNSRDKYNSNKYNNKINPKSSTDKSLEGNINSSFQRNKGKNLSEGDTEYTQEEIHNFLKHKIHEQMEYSEVGFSEYHESCITPIVIYFYDRYNDAFIIQHPVLSNIAYRKIIDAYLNPPKVMENQDIYFETYKKMIDKYFHTDIGQRSGKVIDYHINHFMGKQVREYMYRRVMEDYDRECDSIYGMEGEDESLFF